LAIPPDTFSPDVLEVTEGDNVTVYFYNLDTTDRHTFTIGSPYNLNEDLLPGKNATFTFKAADEGVFRFYCTYHQPTPTMSGELVVLPRPAVEKTNAVTK
jgi:nitrous-oxide reductase